MSAEASPDYPILPSAAAGYGMLPSAGPSAAAREGYAASPHAGLGQRDEIGNNAGAQTELKGMCAVCNKPVFVHHVRTKNAKGMCVCLVVCVEGSV